MTLSFRKQNSNGCVGLDIDGGYLAAIQFKGGTVVHAASMELESGIVEDGDVADAPRLTAALKEFFARERLPREVYLGVANQQIVVRQLEMPQITNEAEREAAVRFQTAEAVAMPLDEAVLDYRVVGEVTQEDGPPRDRVIVVAARRSMVSGFVEAARDAGLKPLGIDLNAFALLRALAHSDDAGESARAYCHLGAVTNLAVAAGSICLFTRPLSAAADPNALELLGEELRLSIEYYLAQADGPAVEEIVLSGPGAGVAGVAERLGDVTGLPVSVAEPLGTLTSLPHGEDPFRHTVSLGLAMEAAA